MRGALRVSFVALSLAAGALGGCDDCGGGAPDPPVRAPGDGGIGDLVPEPTNEEVLALWQQALGSLSVAPGEPAELRYQAPSCGLDYQLRARHFHDVAPGRDLAGIELHADIAANPDGDRVTFQLIKVEGFMTHDGARTDRTMDKGKWPPSLVRMLPAEPEELQGPSAFWSSYTALPPLLWFFPRLPEAKVGSRVAWKMITQTTQATAQIEKRRAEDPDAAVPNFPGQAKDVDIALSEWIRVGDMPAAVLLGTWTDEFHQLDPIESERAEKWRGRYVITADGRLLFAGLVAGKYQWWAASAAEQNSKVGSSEIELRLVGACDGPTLARFPRHEDGE